MEPGVKRVWITFETVSHSLLPALIRQEVGVTAQTEQTAIALVRDELAASTGELPPVLEVVTDVEVSTCAHATPATPVRISYRSHVISGEGGVDRDHPSRSGVGDEGGMAKVASRGVQHFLQLSGPSACGA